MKQFIMFLDGPKGSGKSTVGGLLKLKLSNTDFFGLDEERRKISGAKTNTEFNNQAFQAILENTEKSLVAGKNVVIDSGLKEGRIAQIHQVLSKHKASLFSYAFIAPYNVLLSRVRERDAQKGKTTDEKRFQETYATQQAKDFKNFTIFDTSKISPEDIIVQIITKLQ